MLKYYCKLINICNIDIILQAIIKVHHAVSKMCKSYLIFSIDGVETPRFR
jgi:hypothetical protein